MMSSVSFYISVAAIAAIKGRQQEGNLGEKTAFPSTSVFLSTLEKQNQTKKTQLMIPLQCNTKC